MADFDLYVDQKGFEERGVRVDFDENLYSELLDEFSLGILIPTVNLAPHLGWGLSARQRAATRLTKLRDYITYGGFYDGSLDVNCLDDLEETNDTLLHETKHFIDEESGEVIVDDAVTHKSMLAMASSIAIANLASAYLLDAKDKKILTAGAITLSGVLAMREYKLKLSPGEVKAREFASHPDIVKQYGKIITYRSI